MEWLYRLSGHLHPLLVAFIDHYLFCSLLLNGTLQ
jgi:hypothetical protein